MSAMKYQINGLGLLLFAALVISAHKEKVSEASYNDGGGKELKIFKQIVAFRSSLLYHKILSFYFVFDCHASTTSVSAGLHQLLSENIGITRWSQEVQTSPPSPHPSPPTPLPVASGIPS